MDDELRSDSGSASDDSEAITSIKSFFMAKTLSDADSESTITANTNAQNVYSESQTAISKFGETLAKDAQNITNISDDFAGMDENMSDFLNSESE